MWHILWILLQVSVFFSVIIQECTTDRKSRVHTYTIGLLRQAIVVSWGWLPSVMRADSYRHHCTVGLCQRLVCNNRELKARQEHQQGSRQQKSSQVLDGNSDQLRLLLVDSRAVEVTQSTLQKQLWPVGLWGLKIWEPTSRLLLPPPPPLWVLLLLLHAHSLLWSMAPTTCSEHTHAACPVTVTKCPTLGVTKRCPFSTCSHPLILCSCSGFYKMSCLLINTARFLPNKSTRVCTN